MQAIRTIARLWPLLLVLASAGAQAQPAAVSEEALKAVLFYKLPLYTYRGEAPSTMPILRMCLLGSSALRDTMESLSRQNSDGRAIHFREILEPDEAGDCDFLYVGRSEAARIPRLLERLAGGPAITVSDVPGFAVAGGMIELNVRAEGAGLTILVNRAAARRQGVEFNAQLLRLAEIVED